MQIYIFISESQPSVRAFTEDGTGGNLPREYAPWRAANAGRAMLIGSASDPVAKAVQRDGFFLVSA
jgi:hypothetical protein